MAMPSEITTVRRGFKGLGVCRFTLTFVKAATAAAWKMAMPSEATTVRGAKTFLRSCSGGGVGCDCVISPAAYAAVLQQNTTARLTPNCTAHGNCCRSQGIIALCVECLALLWNADVARHGAPRQQSFQGASMI